MRIQLSNGGETIVDTDWFEELSKWTWYRDVHGYVRRNIHQTKDGKRRTITLKMHRVVLGAKPGQIVDHVNRDRLDNRRSNLRIATPHQNFENNKNGHFLGVPWVTFHRQAGKFQVVVKGKYLGLFATLKEAAQVASAATTALAGGQR
jgi:hypothetical protein